MQCKIFYLGTKNKYLKNLLYVIYDTEFILELINMLIRLFQ